MDYEKIHKDTINRLQQMVNSGKITAEDARGICADFIPESWDDRIRKTLIRYHKSTIDIDGIKGDEIVSWLEKQSEQKSSDNVKPKLKVGYWYIDKQDGTTLCITKVLKNTYKYITSTGEEHYCAHCCLEQDTRPWTIQDAKEGDVLLSPATPEGDKECPFIFKEIGKDGIVRYHAALLQSEELRIADGITNVMGYANAGYHIPAIKELRDLLFQKMHEAGYEWDAEKKELKKIEQNIDTKDISEIEVEELTEQKPDEWSEEDDFNLAWIVGTLLELDGDKKNTDLCEKMAKWLKSLRYRVQPKQYWTEEDERICLCLIEEQEKAIDDVKNSKYGHQEIISDLKEMYRERINWLESFKYRNQWKPSEEQLRELENVFSPYTDSWDEDILRKLHEQLKQL